MDGGRGRAVRPVRPAAGWLIHGVISVVAWVSVLAVSVEEFQPYAERPSTGAGLGLVYPVLLAQN